MKYGCAFSAVWDEGKNRIISYNAIFISKLYRKHKIACSLGASGKKLVISLQVLRKVKGYIILYSHKNYSSISVVRLLTTGALMDEKVMTE